MSSDAKDIFISGTIIVAFIVLVLGGMFAIGKYNCNQVNEMSGKETRFKALGGCYVKVNNQFIPKDNWRGEYER